MVLMILIACILFIVGLQAAIPYLLKPHIVFGVTIPEGHTEDSVLMTYKKRYSFFVMMTGIIAIIILLIFCLNNSSEESIILSGVASQLSVLLVSMGLYVYFHIRTTKRKKEQSWGANLKKVRIADLTSHSNDEMLPNYIFALPMIITIGLIAYTATQYEAMPDLIPTHWGPNGQPDAFTEKNPFSVIALLLISFIMQGMMIGVNATTKKSGIRLNPAKRSSSKVQQLSFRKYTSYFLFLTSLATTILTSFLHITTIHEDIVSSVFMISMPFGFLFVILLATVIYAFKVGQGGARIPVEEEEPIEGVTDFDDDRYWKAGVFYINKEDPSIFVEKRFGIGWTINFGNPIGYLIIFVPLALILIITAFL